jgi:anti-anti-sigma factor
MGSSVVVSATGEVDIATTVQLSQALSAALRRGARGLVCDLTGVSFLGAAGMTTLVLARRRAVVWGTWFDVVCPQPTARRVIALLGLDAVLSLHDGVAEAVDDQARRAGRPSGKGQAVPAPAHAHVACETAAGGSRPPHLARGQLVGSEPLHQKSQGGRPTQGALP